MPVLAETGASKEERDKDSLIIIVKRMELTFNDKECQVLSFTDITMYHQLHKEQENIRMLKMLNMSVNHEMLTPLKANIEISSRLFRKLKKESEKQMA